MKKLYCYFLLLLGFAVVAQKDYFIADTDTVRCFNISYKLTSQSYLASVNYTDTNQDNMRIEDKAYLASITSFYKNGVHIDRIPQVADKPKSYVKWAERVVDGKLKVNFYHSEMTTYGNMSFNHGGAVTTGITKFFIKMPDGTFYDIRKNSDLKKHIVPYLSSCPEFVAAFKGKFEEDYDAFTKMIALYNSLCK